MDISIRVAPTGPPVRIKYRVTTYRVFGGVLNSDLEFPELERVGDPVPRWQLRRSKTPPPRHTLIREVVAPPCTLRLHQVDGGLWYEHLCTASYLISGEGSWIEYFPLPNADPQALRFDILGRVMALALHAGGYLPLHGSAVQVDSGVLGFIAPKGFGKSTLASALVRAGARLVSDDLLVIQPSAEVRVLPGIPQLRLRDDSFGSLEPQVGRVERGPDGKQVISELPDSRIMPHPKRLAAVYWLQPTDGSDRKAATREPLAGLEVARTLVSHGKNASVMGPVQMMELLERALTVARSVPVYQLGISRDLGRMREVTEQLHEWHGVEVPLQTGR